MKLAQLYKDVELADDTDARVADILSRYEVMETEDLVSDQTNEDKNTAEYTSGFLEVETPSSKKI